MWWCIGSVSVIVFAILGLLGWQNMQLKKRIEHLEDLAGKHNNAILQILRGF